MVQWNYCNSSGFDSGSCRQNSVKLIITIYKQYTFKSGKVWVFRNNERGRDNNQQYVQYVQSWFENCKSYTVHCRFNINFILSRTHKCLFMLGAIFYPLVPIFFIVSSSLDSACCRIFPHSAEFLWPPHSAPHILQNSVCL